ncbi:MAG: hypothetical protein J5965_26115 [Aeriscardovia sp.]|nr:hypothetical protein [Aeriscardovia sp.]
MNHTLFMWRKDRFEADVKRVGRSKVSADLFGDKTDTTVNSYYGEKANMNPSLLTIEKFCRYFDRPVNYYVDVDYSSGNEEKVSSPTEASHLRELLQMQKQLLDAKDEQLALLKAQLKNQSFK